MADKRKDLELLAKQGLTVTPAGRPPRVTDEDFGRQTYFDTGAGAPKDPDKWRDQPSVSRASGDNLEDPKGHLTGSALAQMFKKADENATNAARQKKKYYGE